MRTTEALVLLAMVAPACGEVGTETESGDGDDLVDASPEPEVTIDLIDDLEDGDDEILVTGGRRGYWFTVNDQTGTQMPYPDFTPTEGGANGSAYGANTTGTGFTGWGAKVALFLRNEDRSAAPLPVEANFDASPYTGIQFHARGEIEVRVALRTRAPLDMARGGECDSSVDACDDFYGNDVALSPDWREYRVAFASMEQDGWGKKADLDLTTLVAIEFEIDERFPSFDLSVDDVAFYTAAGDDPAP